MAMLPLSDDHTLLDALKDLQEPLGGPISDEAKAKLAVDFIEAHLPDLLRAAEADILLNMLQDEAVDEHGVGIMLPTQVLDAAEAEGVDPRSRQILWNTVSYLKRHIGAASNEG